MSSNISTPCSRHNDVGISCTHPLHLKFCSTATTTLKCKNEQHRIIRTGVRTYNLGGVLLQHVRLAECFDKVGPIVYPDLVDLQRVSAAIVPCVGNVAVSHQFCVHVGQVWLPKVFGGAAMVEGYHKSTRIHYLEREERSWPEVLVGDELRPPVTHAHSLHNPLPQVVEPPELQRPLPNRADRGHQGTILLARPTRLGGEGCGNLLRPANPMPAISNAP